MFKQTKIDRFGEKLLIGTKPKAPNMTYIKKEKIINIIIEVCIKYGDKHKNEIENVRYMMNKCNKNNSTTLFMTNAIKKLCLIEKIWNNNKKLDKQFNGVIIEIYNLFKFLKLTK